MKEQILKLLPEITKISDHELQDKVIACWAEAIAFRDWSIRELQSIPFTLLGSNVKICFIEHVRTCCNMALACNQVLDEAYGPRKTPVNQDYLIAGALLADIGKLLEYDKTEDGKIFKSDYGKQIRHPFSGVGIAFKHGLPSEVMHVIAVHSKEGREENRSPEAIIFHHVDFIDFELVK
jgi:putative nucleotidyltransferase with HDIG domain